MRRKSPWRGPTGRRCRSMRRPKTRKDQPMDPILATWIDDLPALPAARDATPIDDFRDRAILHCNGLQDGGGHLIEAWSSLQGNTTWVRVWKVDHTSGARTPLVDVAR